MKKKILFLVRGYYPNNSASGNLLKPLVDELSKNNQICVISLSNEKNKTQVNSNLVIETLEYPKSKFISSKINGIKSRIINNYFNESIFSVFYDYLSRVDDSQYDEIIAVTYEEMIALSKSKNISKSKKSIFMLEKFFYNNNRKFFINKQTALEKELLQRINITYALPVAQTWLNIKYPDIEYIGLEHPMIVDRTSNFVNNSEVPILLYGGGIDRFQRNPLKIIEFLNNVNSLIDFKVDFYSYGNMENQLKLLDKKYVFFNNNNALKIEEFKKRILGSNILLSIGNMESDIVPSKIFDYISTGKPVIHFSFHENDPYQKYLKEYPSLIILVDDNFINEKNLNLVKKFIESCRNSNQCLDFHEIKKHFIECTPAYVANQIIEKERMNNE